MTNSLLACGTGKADCDISNVLLASCVENWIIRVQSKQHHCYLYQRHCYCPGTCKCNITLCPKNWPATVHIYHQV